MTYSSTIWVPFAQLSRSTPELRSPQGVGPTGQAAAEAGEALKRLPGASLETRRCDGCGCILGPLDSVKCWSCWESYHKDDQMGWYGEED